MSQPTPYNKSTNFRQYAENNTAAPYNPAALDSELDNIETALDETQANLELIQRDDGNLRNGIVSIESLSEAIISLVGSEGWNVIGIWAGGTNYEKDDVVEFGTQTFVCTVSHISNVSFTVDRNAGRWIALTSVTDAASYLAAAIDAQNAAQASAAAALVSENNAETAETAAELAETNAETSATNAASSASTASTSAINASNSAAAAALSETNAATSEANAAASFDSFDDRYLGAKAADPALDNDGNALIEGAIYWNTTSKIFRAYNGSAFQDALAISLNGFSMTGAINESRATVAATATTTPLWTAANGNVQDWTGTPTITALPAAPQAGASRTVYPAAGTLITAGTDILINGVASGQTYTFAAGDKMEIVAKTTTQFQIAITKYDGTPIALNGYTTATPAIGDFIPFVDITDSNNPKKATAEDIAKAALNASGTAPIYACRAWVKFNGTGTVSITASGNVSSITDRGTGAYTVNFTTAMPDANYAAVASVGRGSETQAVASISNSVPPAAGAVAIQTYRSTDAGVEDMNNINVAVFR